MKRTLLIAMTVLLSSTAWAQDGIEFFKGTWQEAFEQAEAEQKMIFVDAYAEWCGPCKRMAKMVFTQKPVGDFYNENFINLKLDMEKSENFGFRDKYPLKAYPTLFYLDAKGEVVQTVVGGQDVDKLIGAGKNALSKWDRSSEYEALYEAGDRDPQLMYNYISALNNAGKPSLKIANDYLKSQKDLTTPENLKVIFAAAHTVDTRSFDLMLKHRAAVVAVTSEEMVANRVADACKHTVKKAIEFESEDLLQEAIDASKKHQDKTVAKVFEADVRMLYARETGDVPTYLKCCKNKAKGLKKQPDELTKMATTLAKGYKDNAAAATLAEQLAKQASAYGNDFSHYFTYAQILKRNGKLTDARSVANTALQRAKEENNPQQLKIVKRFLEGLDA